MIKQLRIRKRVRGILIRWVQGIPPTPSEAKLLRKTDDTRYVDKWIIGGHDGKTFVPCHDLYRWGKSMGKDPKATSGRILKQDWVGDVMVSTVFLGLNHRFTMGSLVTQFAPPILFETMIFGGEHDQYQERYETLEQAKRGHAKALDMVKGT